MTPLTLPPRRPRPERQRWASLAAALLLVPAAARALDATAWSQRQTFTLAAPGLVKLALPADTLDRARTDLADLRILDAAAREVPYALVRPSAMQPLSVVPQQFRAALTAEATVLTLATGTAQPLLAVTLATPNRAFVKPVRVELSSDGNTWEQVADAVPLFRQNGAEQLTLVLPRRTAAWVRLTVDDRREPAVPFTGATLLAGEARPAATAPVAVRRAAIDELPGETVLTLDLGAAHLPLTALSFTATDPLFTRNFTVTVRELINDTVVERPLARGTIYRIALAGLAPAERLTVPLAITAPTRELMVHLDNGDSPPLAFTAVGAERQPVLLVFNATTPGPHTLLLGQPQATAPRYDLPANAADYDHLPIASVALSPVAANPDYRAPETLASVALEGAPLDPQGWAWRKPIALAAAGVQQLELDLDVLAQARGDFADLRLLHAGHQVPYLLERTSLVRPLPLALVSANDPKQPRLSRWQLRLAHAGLPLARLTLASGTTLFQRHLRLYERLTDERGSVSEITLAAAEWTHTPSRPNSTLTLTLAATPRTDTLWLETDNGDNPPLALSEAQAWHPVIRLLFKAAPDAAPTLYYGQRETNAPRYDLNLVAGQLFTAEKNLARLGIAEELNPRAWPTAFMSRSGGVLFWGALILVVGLLFVVVVRLLPKPPAV
jgi:hypothetical protein